MSNRKLEERVEFLEDKLRHLTWRFEAHKKMVSYFRTHICRDIGVQNQKLLAIAGHFNIEFTLTKQQDAAWIVTDVTSD